MGLSTLAASAHPPSPSAWGISTPPTSHRLTLLSPFLPSHLACTLDSYRRCALFLYITLSNYALRRSILLISPPPPPHSQYLHRDWHIENAQCLWTHGGIFFKECLKINHKVSSEQHVLNSGFWGEAAYVTVRDQTDSAESWGGKRQAPSMPLEIAV